MFNTGTAAAAEYFYTILFIQSDHEVAPVGYVIGMERDGTIQLQVIERRCICLENLLYVHLIFFVFQQPLEDRERFVVVMRRPLFTGRRRFVIPLGNLIPRMFVFVTVDAQELPVAAVRRIVIVVVILMMNREFPNPLA